MLLFAFVALLAQLQLPAPLARLHASLESVVQTAPGRAALAVKDLDSGYLAGYNMNESMPAASTIKIPIMVEVFRQMEEGRFGVNRRVELLSQDRDWGSGDIAYSPVGTTYTVSNLLTQMITVSDNTAANMLIRLVGRRNINATMRRLGLHHTHLSDYIRTDEWSIRDDLRTTPSDMVRLLTDMAKHDLIDAWSSREMIAIMERQEINTLLPEPLPDIPIAHKTGSLDDTLDDVGIVYAPQPYVIAVLTTDLPSLDRGRTFIHRVSRVVYSHFAQLARWRRANDRDVADENAPLGQQPQAPAGSDNGIDDQDVSMWATPPPQPEPTP